MRKLDSALLYTNDIPAVVDYYTNKIGLQLEYKIGEDYASFMLDNKVRLGIKKATEERERPGSQAFIMAVEDARAEYEAAKYNGLTIYKELAEKRWGKEFSVLDPDGNKIEFLQAK